MPYDFPIRCIWYNAAMFRERGVTAPTGNWDDPGWSWNDFADAARRLTRPEATAADSVWGVRWGVDLPALFETHYFLLNNGASFFSADGTQCVITEPAGVETLQFMQDLFQRWRVARLPADVQAAGGDRFAAGKLAMDVFRPVQIANYRRDLTFEWALAPLPRGPQGKGRTTIMGGSAWVVPQENKNPEEASELIQHLITPDVERAQARHVGIMPARRQVLDEYAAQEPPKNMKLVLRGAEACQLMPKSPWWAEVQAIAKPILDELWLGARSPSSAAQEIKRLVDEQLKQPFTFKTS
jgi:multiple sugar transport system substrate-binding protein